MRWLLFIVCSLVLMGMLQAQNVGIGNNTPLQKLDVNGAVKIGTTTTNNAGTVRFNSGKFEGGDGTSWKSLEGLPAKAIILARAVDTAEIKLAGYDVFKMSSIDDTFNVSYPTNYPGQWTNYPPVNPSAEPTGIYNFENVLYNNKLIYYGFDNVSNSALFQFDISTQQWSQLTPVSPLAFRTFESMTLVGDEIYIFGGMGSANPFVGFANGAKYNLLTNNWFSVANIPVISFYHSSCAIGTDIYIIGGASSMDPTGQFIQANKKLYKYNTLTNTWSGDLSNSNTPFSYQGNAHNHSNNLLLVNSDTIREYNPVSNTYTSLYPFITPGNPLLTNIKFVSRLVSDKVNIYGYISDTLFASNTSPILLHYQFNLTNGQTASLNTCNAISPVDFYFTYQYITSLGKFYFKNGISAGTKMYDPSGSVACTVSGYVNTFLYYMKKQ